MKWLLSIFLTLTACEKNIRPPLTTEAYVWQAADKQSVREAISLADGKVSKLHFRAAELKWTSDRFAIQRFIKVMPTPGSGLVVRIGSSASQLEWTLEQIDPVARIFRELALLGPSEIQCDFDCPQKRLAGYSKLLEALQVAAGATPVLPTALPSWLDEPAFRHLIATRPGYVLQVHSLQLPKRPSDPPVIFDPVTAQVAVEKAAALGTPFRVAMATYGCEIRFNSDGRVLDVISEDTSTAAPAFSTRAFAYADPTASAELVRKWSKNRPAGMTGIIWYRLPVAGDQRNWPWETFERVVRGDVSESHAVLEASDGPGARDLHVVNRGHFPAALPAEIIVTTPVAAADAAGAYRLEAKGDNALHFMLRPEVWPWLDPAKKISAGWLRTRGERAPINWHCPP